MMVQLEAEGAGLSSRRSNLRELDNAQMRTHDLKSGPCSPANATALQTGDSTEQTSLLAGATMRIRKRPVRAVRATRQERIGDAENRIRSF
jgi:hypothetical protein